MNDRILFVVVLYRTDYFTSATYKSILFEESQYHVYIFDNSPEPQIIKDENVTYIHHPENPGLSFAYNEAARFAKEHNYEWMILLDQDTHFPKGLLNEYINCIHEHPDIHIIAPPVNVGRGKYMSPVKLWWKMGLISKNVPHGKTVSLYDYSPINSGMCISVKSFYRAGGYKSEVFLDYSDFQFIERVRRVSDKCFILNTEIYQEFSALVDDESKVLSRYKQFCLSLKYCDKPCVTDRLGFAVVVIKRGASLVFKTHSFKPIQIFFKHYLK